MTTIGVHLECAIQAEKVVELELALIERKHSRRFRHKVKGHVELKIDKTQSKTFSYDFSKLQHSNPNCFGANLHLHPN